MNDIPEPFAAYMLFGIQAFILFIVAGAVLSGMGWL